MPGPPPIDGRTRSCVTRARAQTKTSKSHKFRTRRRLVEDGQEQRHELAEPPPEHVVQLRIDAPLAPLRLVHEGVCFLGATLLDELPGGGEGGRHLEEEAFFELGCNESRAMRVGTVRVESRRGGPK